MVLADVLIDLLFLTTALVSSDAVVVLEAKLNVPEPSVLSTSPSLPSVVGNVNVTPPDTTFTAPVPFALSSKGEFDSLVDIVLSVIVTPSRTEVPSTSIPVPFNNFNSSLFNLTAILFAPAFLTLNSIAPSSVPSDASVILPDIEPYCTSWSASFSPLNLILPR